MEPYEEIQGKLSSITFRDGQKFLQIGNEEIAVRESIEAEKYVGKKISILKTEDHHLLRMSDEKL